VSKLPLDLSFQPIRAGKNLNRLSLQDVEHYNSEGYVASFDIYDAQEIKNIRSYVDSLMEAMGEAGAYGINCYQARLSGLWNIATDDRILDCVEDIIGPDIVCWASAVLSKRPRDPKQIPWHQDACFWSLSPARTVTVWLAIDDADERNSAMQFIPRTHRQGKIPETTMDEGSVFHKGIKITDEMCKPVSNNLEAGQISLHADMLVHGSPPNDSDKRRCGLTLRYCPPTVKVIDEIWAQGVEAIICRGSDRSGSWTHHPRPQNNDIAKATSPHVIGNN